MQSSWEILSLLLKVMGTVVGLALLGLTVFLVARDATARKKLARAWEVTLIVLHFARTVGAEYARTFAAVCSQHLLSRGRKIARAFSEAAEN